MCASSVVDCDCTGGCGGPPADEHSGFGKLRVSSALRLSHAVEENTMRMTDVSYAIEV